MRAQFFVIVSDNAVVTDNHTLSPVYPNYPGDEDSRMTGN